MSGRPSSTELRSSRRIVTLSPAAVGATSSGWRCAWGRIYGMRGPPPRWFPIFCAMRVLHIVPARFGPRGVVGGAERYAFELARHMAEATPTRMVTFGEEARDERVGDLRIRVLGHPWYVRG